LLPRVRENARRVRSRSSLGTLKVVELAHLRGRQQLGGRVRRVGVELGLSCCDGAHATAGGSGISSAARSRNATAAAAPPRIRVRSAQRSISSATPSSGHGAAWARGHARRSGSASGSVASAKTRCAARRSPGRPSGRRRSHHWVAKAHAAAESDQSCGFRWSRRVHCDLLPHGRAPHQAHVTTGSAAAVSSSCCVSRGSTLNCR